MNNPYATSAISDTDEAIDVARLDTRTPVSTARVITRWTLICVVSAAPSFTFGFFASGGQWLAMLLGVVIFIGGYIAADLASSESAWRQNRMVIRAMRFTYGLRLFISIVFPIGAYMDVFAGFISMGIVSVTFDESMEDGEMGFGLTLVTTLLQGVVLNIVLMFIGAMVLAAMAGWSALSRRHVKDQPSSDWSSSSR